MLLQEADREIQELLAWMRQDEGLSDDEEADMLMALAEQAGPTPRSQSQRSSQQVGGHFPNTSFLYSHFPSVPSAQPHVVCNASSVIKHQLQATEFHAAFLPAQAFDQHFCCKAAGSPMLLMNALPAEDCCEDTTQVNSMTVRETLIPLTV